MAGTVVTYTLTVTNSGDAAAHSVLLSDTLPAGLVYGGGDGTFAGGVITRTFDALPASGGASSGWFRATAKPPYQSRLQLRGQRVWPGQQNKQRTLL